MELKQCSKCGKLCNLDYMYEKDYKLLCDKCFVEMQDRRIDDIRESADTE